MLNQLEPNSHRFPQIVKISTSTILQCLKNGFQDTLISGFPSLFYGACFALAGSGIYLLLSDAMALFVGLTTGFFLLGPALAMGLYHLSQQISSGVKPKLLPSLFAWRSNVANLGLFAGMLTILLLIWARASLVIFAIFFEGGLPTTQIVLASVMKMQQPVFTLIYFTVGGIFATFVFCTSVIAVPLISQQNTDAITAGIASIKVCLSNPAAMFFWALCIVTLTALSFFTGFIGLIITMPILGHSTWHVYRAVIKA